MMGMARALLPKYTNSSYNSKQNKKVNSFKTQDLNIHFSKEGIQMDSRHMKRSPISLITREMQIKTTKKYHLTPLKMVTIKKSPNNKC